MFSPYAAMGNAPESMVDPNGTSPGRGAYSFSPNNPVMADMGATEGTKKMAFNQISVGGGFGGSGKGSSANENTQTLTLTGMLYTAYLQVGETANFSDGVFVSYGVMLPELEVVDHKPNYLSWGQGVNSQLGSISPLGSGFDDFAYNKAMANPYFRAAEMGYMPPMGSLHGTLDAAGLLPGIGEIFDGINGIYYIVEGDNENAAWSFAAMIPIGGTAITGAKIFRKAAKEGTSLIARGLGSTGRTIAANLTEELAMKEIVANPTLGKTVMTGMKDSRWLGWDKLQYTHNALDGTKTTIHYVGQFEDGVLKAVDDFKFK